MYKIGWTKLREEAILPQYATEYSVGLDLFTPYDFTINPGEKIIVKLGLTCSFPTNIELQIRSKSGLTAKFEIVTLNSPGTIESDYYPNEIGVILKNFGTQSKVFKAGDAVAQAVFSPVAFVDFPGKIEPTVKRTGGFGHTSK